MEQTGGTYKFYVDESGHTGQDLVGSDQLFFALAGVGIPNDTEQALAKDIEHLIAKHKITFELKANTMIGTKFEPVIIEVVNLLLKANFLPVFSILEKRFMVTGRIVEEFFDPAYNKNTDNSWTFPIPIKRELADYFYNKLSTEAINTTALAFRTATVENLEKAYSLIDRDTDNARWRRIFEGVKNSLLELSNVYQDQDASIPRKTLNAPNYPLFHDLIQQTEGHLRARGARGDIYFDFSKQFNQHYAQLFENLKNAPPAVMNFPGKTHYYGFEGLDRFHVIDSEDSIFIQIADLFAGSLNSFFLKLHKAPGTWTLSKSEEFWLYHIYLFLDNGYGDWVVSEGIKKKFGALLTNR